MRRTSLVPLFAIAVVLVTGLIVAGCQVVVIPVPVPVNVAPMAGVAPAVQAADDGLTAAAPAAATANDVDVLAQFDAFDAACSSKLTNAQQERALAEIRPFFAGREVQLTGTVADVRDFGGTFDVIVSLLGTNRDVRVDSIPEEQALALNKGDRVLLVGDIDMQGCWAYVTVVGTLSGQ